MDFYANTDSHHSESISRQPLESPGFVTVVALATGRRIRIYVYTSSNLRSICQSGFYYTCTYDAHTHLRISKSISESSATVWVLSLESKMKRAPTPADLSFKKIMNAQRAVSALARRAVVQAKAVKPVRGGKMFVFYHC